MKKIKIHEKYGFNPTISICYYCGADKGIACLGASYKEKAPMKSIVDYEPCPECEKYFDTDHLYFEGGCNHSGFIQREDLKKIIKEDIFEKLKSHNFFKVDKCPACAGCIPQKVLDDNINIKEIDKNGST